jgi:hypothetical protein
MMIVFDRLPPPSAIVGASCATLPLAVWCRSSALLALRDHGAGGQIWRSGGHSPVRARRARTNFAAGACLLAAGGVLRVAGLLLRARLLRPGGAALVLGWSSWLTSTALRLWRRDHRRAGS